MTDKKKDKRVPKLRFPEFKDEWKKKTLGSLCATFKSGIGITSDRIKEVGDYPVYGGNGFRGYTDIYTHEGFYILIGRQGALCGNINRVYEKNYISEHAIAVNANHISDTEWLAQKLDFLRLNRFSESSAQPGLAVNKLIKLKLYIPTLPEQKKIAAFLTTVDKKIQQLTRKKELLEKFKKGMMQKIFSREVRFKQDDGKEFPDWEEKRLGNFLNLTIREVPKPKKKYLAIGVRSHCRGTFHKVDSEPDAIAMNKLYIVRKNDLIVNITFAWEGAIALVKEEDDGGLVSHRFPTYTFDRKVVLYEFFQYIFTQKNFRSKLELISPGGAGRNRVLNKKDFLKIKSMFPSLPEQQKIANFFENIDIRIQTTQKQLEKTQTFKKGLLQQMFV